MKNKSHTKNAQTKQRLFNSLVLSVCLLATTLPAYCAQIITLKQTAFKFLMAMGGVLVSTLIIYFGLTVYNKLFHGSAKHKKQTNSLIHPQNVDDAIDFFIQKNKL